MKSFSLTAFCAVAILFFSFNRDYAQNNILNAGRENQGWTTSNPFQTDVFVENLGQFDNWAKTPFPVKYVVNSSDQIFFTQHGLTFKLEKEEKINEKEREEQEREGGKGDREAEIYFVNMYWEACNPDATVEVSELSEGYYTFGEQGYENAKARGYRKLIYKNLYPNIDAEYVIPKNGGIKYTLLLHPGADLSKVKMRYDGNVKKLSLDRSGNVIIKTPVGNITDHAPQSFYAESKTNILSSFELKENTVSFKLNQQVLSPTGRVREGQPIIIDPWTTTPSSLTTDNVAYDVDGDDYGNVYVGGGKYPFKLAKYSNTGSLLWTFTNPAGFASIRVYDKMHLSTKYCSKGRELKEKRGYKK